MKKFIKVVSIVLVMCILVNVIPERINRKNNICKAAKREYYGVFIGASRLDYKKLGKYDKVVIDAEYFSKAEISKLKKAGVKKVFSYLNVGSLEDFRTYYSDYKDLILGKYENWPGEYWIDVSNKRWQDLCIKRAKTLKKKGVDGMFIDNCDVYYQYPKEKIYNGLDTILKKIKKNGLSIIINGGDSFVKRVMKKVSKIYIDAVNQETVCTAINFSTGKFKKADTEEKKYFTEYLNKAKKKGIRIYVLEYATKSSIATEARKYAKKNGWNIYVSKNLELNY